VFFYELHEGDDQVYSDVLVVSDSEWEPQEFFEVVQRIRRDIGDQYDRDTLIEAIAVVLERDHGFVFVSDDRLIAAVNVSTQEDDNFLVDLEGGYEDDDDDDDDDRDDDEPRGDYRTLVTDVEFDIDGGSRPN
jgi:hypothetical protein